jgi:hypothetical protein
VGDVVAFQVGTFVGWSQGRTDYEEKERGKGGAEVEGQEQNKDGGQERSINE